MIKSKSKKQRDAFIVVTLRQYTSVPVIVWSIGPMEHSDFEPILLFFDVGLFCDGLLNSSSQNGKLDRE
jgi:hypothetical protein